MTHLDLWVTQELFHDSWETIDQLLDKYSNASIVFGNNFYINEMYLFNCSR